MIFPFFSKVIIMVNQNKLANYCFTFIIQIADSEDVRQTSLQSMLTPMVGIIDISTLFHFPLHPNGKSCEIGSQYPLFRRDD
jgi:hypothetical protein